MSLAAGTKLGPYEVVGPLGTGGMGEVYRAKDTRLDRSIAIKILPTALSSDSGRLHRFQYEARILSTLNHPNVLAIYDVGEQNGIRYLVSEFLEGQSLRDKLAEGALSRWRIVEYSLEIAKGLAAAHEKGVVHRDLKPENVFVTSDDHVKILDFGLAKQSVAEQTAEESATVAGPTEAGPIPTTPGTVMGTVGYMSPEQVRGQVLDHRSDIFSFGAVLYEMVSGRSAFRRESSVETMNAILKEDVPELSIGVVQVSPGLERIVRRCLEKKPERRFQSASDLAFAIESLSGTSSTQTLKQQSVPRAWLPWTATALGVLLLGAGLWFLARWSAPKAQPKFTRLTYEDGYPSNARFAKDGGTVVYSAQWKNDPLQTYSVRVEFPQSTKVDLPSAALLSLSSTGDVEIALDTVYHHNFLSGTMAHGQMAGSNPHPLENDVIAADYAPDGATLAVARRTNGKVQLEYPRGKVVYATSGYLDYVRVSPSGKEVAFLEHPVYDDDRGWVSFVDATGRHKQLTKEFASAQGLAWSRTGKEVWFTATGATTDLQLYAVSLSGKQREVLSTPQRTRLFDIAADGRVLLSSEEYRTDITGIDPVTRKEHEGLEWFNGSSLSDITPDGKAILFSEWGGPAGALYLVGYRKLDGSAPVGLGPGTAPRFSPDGTMVAALILSIPPQLALDPLGPGDGRRLSLGNITTAGRVAWFPDSKHLLLTGATEGQALRTYQMDIARGKPEPLGPPDFTGIAVARDGKRIIGRNASGEAVILDLENGKEQVIPGIEPQDEIQSWTKDGQALLVFSATAWEATMYRVETASGKRALLQKVVLSQRAGSTARVSLEYAEDSKTYAYNSRRILGALYVVEGLE